LENLKLSFKKKAFIFNPGYLENNISKLPLITPYLLINLPFLEGFLFKKDGCIFALNWKVL